MICEANLCHRSRGFAWHPSFPAPFLLLWGKRLTPGAIRAYKWEPSSPPALRKSSRISRNTDVSPTVLAEKEAAQLQAEISAAVQSFASTAEQSADDAKGNETDQQKQTERTIETDATHKSADAPSKSQGERAASADFRKPPDAEKPVSSGMNAGKTLANGKSSRDPPLPTVVDSLRASSGEVYAGKPPSEGTNGGKPVANGTDGKMSELHVILQGTRLQELREEHEKAQKVARDNPKDLEALQEAAVSAAALAARGRERLGVAKCIMLVHGCWLVNKKSGTCSRKERKEGDFFLVLRNETSLFENSLRFFSFCAGS